MTILLRCSVLFSFVVSLVGGCVSHIQPYEKKVRSYTEDDYAVRGNGRTSGSLWSDSGLTLFEDHRAVRLGDIITVKIAEESGATRDASTSTSRESDSSFGVGSFFGSLAKLVAKICKIVMLGAIGRRTAGVGLKRIMFRPRGQATADLRPAYFAE